MLAAGNDLAPFWFGKIGVQHVPVIEELAARGLLQRPRSVPQFLGRPDARERIAKMRSATALSSLI
jgi:hypothetical protein